MTPERYKKIRDALDHRQPDLTVLTDQVHKPHNVGAILRTCDAVGIPEIHVTHPKQKYRQYRRRSMGSYQWVNIKYHERIKDSADILKERGFKLYAAHFSDQAVIYSQADFTSPCALILGAEKEGVSSKAAAGEHIITPMQGIMVSSYNVSVAAAIILVEDQRQRQ